MKNKSIIIILFILIAVGIVYLNRNNYYKGDLYYIEKVQAENHILYNGKIPKPDILKTINYNKDIKIIFWEDSEKGVTCSILEHFDRKWISIGGNGIGGITLNNLSFIEYKPVNYKLPEIYIWNSLIQNEYSKVILDNEHTFKTIPLKNNKEIIYYITTKNIITGSNYTPIVNFYNENKLIKQIQSCIL